MDERGSPPEKITTFSGFIKAREKEQIGVGNNEPRRKLKQNQEENALDRKTEPRGENERARKQREWATGNEKNKRRRQRTRARK
jgi:hypothetical protein